MLKKKKQKNKQTKTVLMGNTTNDRIQGAHCLH